MTNKEIAERLRDIAQAMRVAEIPMPHVVEEVADDLDPPKPKMGICRFSWGSHVVWMDGLCVGNRVYYSPDGNCFDWQPADECTIKPARILADDKVAMKPGEIVHHNGRMYKLFEIPPVRTWPEDADKINLYRAWQKGSLYYTGSITRAEAEGREG
jgi:hypothetical protein